MPQTRETMPSTYRARADATVRLRVWLAVLAPILVFVALATWAFSSPVGSSPDDNFHLPSIWCGLGEREGLCEASGDPETRLVPAPLVDEPCFAREPEISAACWNANRSGLVETDRVNVGALYPPVFYGVMSMFASTDVVVSVLMMRLFNAALFTGLVTGAVFALPRALRREAIMPLVVTMVPLGLFVVPSTNASSWALLSAAVLWITLYGAVHAEGRRQWVLLGLAVLAGVIGAGARADAAAFAVLSVLLVVGLTASRTRRFLTPAFVGAGIIAMSTAFYLSASQSAALTEGLPTGGPSLTFWELIDNFLSVPNLWVGMFGGWALGWLDTPLPATVNVLSSAVFAMAIASGLHDIGWRKATALAVLFAGLWLVPFVLLWKSHAVEGAYVQPRYFLPLAVILIGVALLHRRPAERRPLPAGLAITGIALLSIAHTVALHVQLNRYTSGFDMRTVVPGRLAEWWWSSAPPVWVVWALGSLAFTAALVALQTFSTLTARASGSHAALTPTTDSRVVAGLPSRGYGRLRP